MGLARGAAALLLEESKRKPFGGNLATLGVQSVYMSTRDLSLQFERFGIKPAIKVNFEVTLDHKLLFAMMGFASVKTLDYSDFEGADYVVDLNYDDLPGDLHGKFDVVLDSGTLEHVFHIPNAMKNIVNLVNVGGRIIFLSPSSNHMDHGFYMFSPTFFVDYFLANKFEINTGYVVRYSPNLEDLWDAYQYDPERWRDLHIGGLDDKPYALFFVVTRTAESTVGIIPQQNYYADNAAMYAGTKIAENDDKKAQTSIDKTWALRLSAENSAMVPQRLLRRYVGKVLRRIPLINRIIQHVLLQFDKKHLNKKLVGRY